MNNFYIEYIKSDEWKSRAAQARKLAGFKCQRCGAENVVLEVHHLTYDNLGEEEDEDLKVVCKPCHEKEDRIRVRRERQARKDKAFHTYAENVWGEEWQMEIDPDEAYEEFSDWFDSRN